MNCRDLAALTQPVKPEDLQRAQAEALERLREAEAVHREALNASPGEQEEAEELLSDAIARCEEFDALGKACS